MSWSFRHNHLHSRLLRMPGHGTTERLHSEHGLVLLSEKYTRFSDETQSRSERAGVFNPELERSHVGAKEEKRLPCTNWGGRSPSGPRGTVAGRSGRGSGPAT